MEFSLLAKAFRLSNKQLLAVLACYPSLEAFFQASLDDIEPLVGARSFRLIKPWRRSGVLPEAYGYFGKILDDHGGQVLNLADQHYPALLAEIPSPPAVIFIRGSLSALLMPQIAIVGSRRATAGGVQIAGEFSRQMGSAGFAITSGLALGIDAAAHQGALSVSMPTIAVMGTGIDQIYPARHTSLANQILASGGALITEFLPGSPPKPAHFPRRNRIITGLSLGVVVIEAGERSGSLISARLAAEQGREVCVVPGSLRSPVSAGCHRLIREGATLVTSAGQVVEQLGCLLEFQAADADEPPSGGEGESSHWLLELMGFDPYSADQLCVLSGRSVVDITSGLTELEMAGKVSLTPYGYQRIA